MLESVILVDEFDNEIGVMEKIEAHKKALKHRAFSGFIFNCKKELLLQRRSFEKYHNGGIWSNTVCSHPHPNEKTIDGIKRRIFEEFGFNSTFEKIGEFKYCTSFPNGLTENEYDHVFVGKYDNQKINPNPSEICEYKWISRENLLKEIDKNHEGFSFWLKEILRLGLLGEYFD